jgi:adenosylcobyric acid synthase
LGFPGYIRFKETTVTTKHLDEGIAADCGARYDACQPFIACVKNPVFKTHSRKSNPIRKRPVTQRRQSSAACIAVLGTGSDVGKSVIATALCRLLANRGMAVAPFKAQNMSNNSGVTAEGLEMGRAQIVQAEAARIAPHVDMNPILLKPTSEKGAQVVLLGKAVADRSAADYHKEKERLFAATAQALDRLRDSVDVVVIEGAGSCAEVNLMAHDIVNFRTAVYADAPVILVGDIHRGGIFAQLVGTLACIEKELQDRVAGFIVNRFRGDLDLFRDGVHWIEQRSGKPVFGVVPWYSDFVIEAEDSVVIEKPETVDPRRQDKPTVAVIRVPHISNFTDFDPLRAVGGLCLVFVERVQDLDGFKAVILPGSKNTRADLAWLMETGWADRLRCFVENGGHVLGICGGFQMLGKTVHDPAGLEGRPGVSPGLDLLPVETVLKAPKTTTLTRFVWQGAAGAGYEIHMGQSPRSGGTALLQVVSRNGQSCNDEDGCWAHNHRVLGTYVHGLFDAPAVTAAWLEGIGIRGATVSRLHGPAARDQAYEQLAAHFARHVDVESILGLITHAKS